MSDEVQAPNIEWACVFQDDRPGVPVYAQSQTWTARFGDGWLVRHFNLTGNETMTYVPDAISGLGNISAALDVCNWPQDALLVGISRCEGQLTDG